MSEQRDASNWAKGVQNLEVGDLPTDAINRNVAGRRVMSPIQGFGKMWQKTYKVSIPASLADPRELIATWKQNFPNFWPSGNRFYGPITGIAPGEVAVINMDMPGKLKLSTGVLVLYADDESFTLMTPQGHMFAGWITFSATLDGDNTLVQAQVLMRANDPLYEVGLTMGGHKKEDSFWIATLTNLAQHFGVKDPSIQTTIVCVDKRRQWGRWSNIRHNSALRSGLPSMTTRKPK